MTPKARQSTTEPRHWSNETAADAVQAAMEARALMLATARALGLPDERVEDAPQEAEQLRTQLAQIRAILAGILTDAGIEVTDDVVRLAVQVRAQVRALEAERDEARAELKRIQVLVDELRLELPNLREQLQQLLTMDKAAILFSEAERAINRGTMIRLTAALHEILDEAHGDCDRAAILAAARGALVEDE